MIENYSRITGGKSGLYDSILDAIGNTPSFQINKLAPDHVCIFVKAEFLNPAGSVKDRLAIGIIEEAEQRGDLESRQAVI